MNYGEINPQIEYFINRHSSPSWIIEDATTSFIDLTYIHRGRAFYTVNGVIHTVCSGDMICIPQGSRRSAFTDPEDPMVSFALNFQLYDKDNRDVVLPFPTVSHIGEPEELLALYYEMTLEWLKRDQGFELKARGLLLMILHKYFKYLVYKNTNRIDKRIQNAVSFILGNLQGQIDIEELAKNAGLTAAYFGTLFKSYMGMSIKEYITRMRISNAENMLLSGEFTVQEAAYKCGIEDFFYFSKLFKKIKGFPPSKILLENKKAKI